MGEKTDHDMKREKLLLWNYKNRDKMTQGQGNYINNYVQLVICQDEGDTGYSGEGVSVSGSSTSTSD